MLKTARLGSASFCFFDPQQSWRLTGLEAALRRCFISGFPTPIGVGNDNGVWVCGVMVLFRPFRAYVFFAMFFPGRCPGLYCFRPVGAVEFFFFLGIGLLRKRAATRRCMAFGNLVGRDLSNPVRLRSGQALTGLIFWGVFFYPGWRFAYPGLNLCSPFRAKSMYFRFGFGQGRLLRFSIEGVCLDVLLQG